MDRQLINSLKLTFDDIAHETDDGVEFWYARELMPVLGYSKWQNFSAVIEKAKTSCVTTNGNSENWFTDVSKPITFGKGKVENISDCMLT